MPLYSLRWKSVNWNERMGVKEKNGCSLDLKGKQISLFLLIKLHLEMAWITRMLSNLYHSCHNNDLNQDVWISSCLFLYKLHDKLLGENITPVTQEPLISWWWPLLFTPTLLPKPGIRQQSKSIATARNPKLVCFGGSKLNKRARKTQPSFLYARLFINFSVGQVGGFIGSILLSHRWETMYFIPLHCKSNLMLHAL